MGMQCTFNYQDLFESQGCVSTYDRDSDTWIAHVASWDASFNLGDYKNSSTSGGFCWFDVGRGTPEQMRLLRLLIQARISFTCA